ncbi:hypothetical protein BDV98DRAFT_577544 [Pterulicium gracile]|uniref:Uncharacterized protein n=1 Tax=Pterulicium gracile TaxID=1884261 RepID=A0A5C3Q0S9_9AGAR|nr:hypothetical protein BDV98DRAFT_577544 [Pterula gracilis]
MPLTNCILCAAADSTTLYTNSQLHNQSLAFIASDLANANSLVEELREKIAAGQEAIEKLTKANLHMQAHLDAQLNLIVPIHRLPDDILLSIFTIPVDELEIADDSYCSGQELDNTDAMAPWATAAVCKRWRDIALSSSQLWSKFVYHTGLDHWQGGELEARRLFVQFERASAVIPFASLQSQFIDEETAEDTQFTKIDIDALTVFVGIIIPRCRKLALHGFIPDNLPPSGTLAVDLLQDLLINSEAWLPSGAFEHAPRLASLTLQGVGPYPFPRLLVPWARLKSLTIDECAMDLQDVLDMLKLTSQLHFLSLSADISDEEVHEDDSANLPTLRVLRLPSNRNYGTTMGILLGRIIASHLHTLDISLHSSVFYHLTLKTSMVSIGGFQTSLTSLTIPWPLCDLLPTLYQDGLELFCLLTSLQRLRLRVKSDADVALRILTWDASGDSKLQTNVCPALCELHCEPGEPYVGFRQSFKFTAWEALCGMVKSRLPHPEFDHLLSLPHNSLRVVSLGPRSTGDWLAGAWDSRTRSDSHEEKSAFDWLVEASNAGIFELRLVHSRGADRNAST